MILYVCNDLREPGQRGRRASEDSIA